MKTATAIKHPNTWKQQDSSIIEIFFAVNVKWKLPALRDWVLVPRIPERGKYWNASIRLDFGKNRPYSRRRIVLLPFNMTKRLSWCQTEQWCLRFTFKDQFLESNIFSPSKPSTDLKLLFIVSSYSPASFPFHLFFLLPTSEGKNSIIPVWPQTFTNQHIFRLHSETL